MSIRVLPPEVASQIAAGEVVERPASVVKELVENALDAGARSVTVEVKGAGRGLVRVADDGAGIEAGELAMAVARHATSKLTRAEDLFRIATLGFRGEALASIGSVSRLVLTSRPPASAAGARLRVEGGELGRLEAAGAPPGTVVQVEDLFYNVPARLKFLKQDATERRQIDALMTRYALAYPQVRFRLVQEESVVLETSGDGDRRAILAALYGVEVARQMVELSSEQEAPGSGTGAKHHLSGFLSPVGLTRSNRREITFFINGRWVQNTPLTAALLQGYHSLLMVGRYPLAVLFLEVPPQEVDVNVHPAKAEVRFREPDRIFSFVAGATRKALLAHAPLPQMTSPALWGRSGRSPERSGDDRAVDPAWLLAQDTGMAIEQIPGPFLGPSVWESHPLPGATGERPLLRLIGQAAEAYLVAEGADGLYLIDQHAAHERVLFEKLMAQHGQERIPSQALLSPAVVDLPPAQARMLAEQLPVLTHLGFEVEAFGPAAFQVRGLPALFTGADPAAALRSLVEQFEEDETPLQDTLEARIAGRVCKRLAVRAGQVLSPDQQRALLTDLEACAAPRTCPHGRPTMIQLSAEMIERLFGRRGAR